MKKYLILIAIFIFALTSMKIFSQENVYKDDNIFFKIPDGWAKMDVNINQNQYIELLKVIRNSKINDAKIYFYALKSVPNLNFDQNYARTMALTMLNTTFPVEQKLIQNSEKLKIDSKLTAIWEHWQGSRKDVVTAQNQNYESPMGYVLSKNKKIWLIMITEVPVASGQALIDEFMKIIKSVE